MSMAYPDVVCNKCSKSIGSQGITVYPNENWCRDCEPVQMRELRVYIKAAEQALSTVRNEAVWYNTPHDLRVVSTVDAFLGTSKKRGR